MTGGCLVAGSIIVAIEKRLGDNPQACRRLDSIIGHWTHDETNGMLGYNWSYKSRNIYSSYTYHTI